MDFGHLTLLLSDLVGTSGHVFATSKNPVSAEVNQLIADWLGRDGDAEDDITSNKWYEKGTIPRH